MDKFIDKAEFLEATQKGDNNGIVAIKAIYDLLSGRVLVDLSSGVLVGFKARDFQGLDKATDADLAKITITPSGRGLYFESLDVDVYLPSLLEGFMGSRSWMASQMGKKGGSSTTEAKSKSSRENGKLGGRPRNAA
ncbi:MAG: DUF2442 domain-containing protein [Thiotrichales bacterium]|jgi:hypothetical protein|nr:DUF2442 domain-containing protein [Thiotrichales bacterium]